MNNGMLDLEYLARTPNAVVLSIGLAAFDRDAGAGPSFYVVLDRDEQQAQGRVVDAPTQKWWAEQSPEAREAIWGQPQERVDAALAQLEEFVSFVTQGRIKEFLLWGNGADNDNAKLENLYAWAGRPWPFGVRSARCYRTLKSMFPEWLASAEAKEKRTTHHNAQDDAEYQARCCVRMLRKQKAILDMADGVAVLSGPEDDFGILYEGPEKDALRDAFERYDRS